MQTIFARDLQEHMWINYGGRLDMRVDSVEYTRDGDVRVQCDYGGGDASCTNFYEQDDCVQIYHKE